MEEKAGRKIIMDESGEPGAYNDYFENTINIQKALDLGFVFDNLHGRIDEVLNSYNAGT